MRKILLALTVLSPLSAFADAGNSLSIPAYWYGVPLIAVVALAMAFFFYKAMMKADPGSSRMQEIAQYVREGAYAYLHRQYRTVTYVFAAIFVIFAILAFMGIQNPFVPVAFLTGGFFSGLCGYLGMKTATHASARTANGARTSLNQGLTTAFRGGAVMGLVVVGFGLLDISAWFFILNFVYDQNLFGLGLTIAEKISLAPSGWSESLVSNPMWAHAKRVEITTTMLTFGMGASLQALFARVGGGIYTKAADVGADLVGKVEAGIPEDDPRNPATIADNVGDNVGDVAGMGADLYESYCGSILATMALGASAFFGDTGAQMKSILAPMCIAAIGVVLSIIGIFAVRTKEGAGLKQLLGSLSVGTNLAASLIAVLTFVIFYWLGFDNWWQLSLSVISGLLAGVIIGKVTEYYTSHSYKPTQRIAESSQTRSEERR